MVVGIIPGPLISLQSDAWWGTTAGEQSFAASTTAFIFTPAWANSYLPQSGDWHKLWSTLGGSLWRRLRMPQYSAMLRRHTMVSDSSRIDITKTWDSQQGAFPVEYFLSRSFTRFSLQFVYYWRYARVCIKPSTFVIPSLLLTSVWSFPACQ